MGASSCNSCGSGASREGGNARPLILSAAVGSRSRLTPLLQEFAPMGRSYGGMSQGSHPQGWLLCMRAS